MKKLLSIALLAIVLASCTKESQEEIKPQNVYEYEVNGVLNYNFYEPTDKAKDLPAGTHFRTVKYEPNQSVRAIAQYPVSRNRLIKITIKKNGIVFLKDSAMGYLDVRFVAE